jgi:hypothetical protein
MITVDTFKLRVAENTATYIHQMANNSFDLKKYHGFDVIAGSVTSTILSSKAHDIRCAVILGLLPILGKKTGPDAKKLVGIIFQDVELKSSYTDESKFYKTERNTVYSVSQDAIINGTAFKRNTTGLKSSYNAAYNIKDNISSKGIHTCLVIFDSRNDDVIDSYEIDSQTMTTYLNGRTASKTGSLTIKLSTFMSKGVQSTTVIPVVGFDNWRYLLLPSLPLIKVINDDETIQRSKDKRLLNKSTETSTISIVFI